MHSYLLRALLVFSVLLSPLLLHAQDDAAQDSLLKNAPFVFVDCYQCDIDYMRQQIPYLNYVRDRKAANVHVLVTTQRTASDGQEYAFQFIGQEQFAGMNDTLIYVADVNATEAEVREGRVRTFQLGMIRYLVQTPLASQLSVGFEKQLEPTDVEDPWNNWVFSLSSSAWMNGESSYSNLNTWSSIDVSKITPKMKYEFGGSLNYRENKFLVDGETITSTFRSQSIYGRAVKSINDHWSWGIAGNWNTSLFSNFKANVWLFPGIEYNLFPYQESTRHELRFYYRAGPNFKNYHDTTIFNKTEELLWANQLDVVFLKVEKWGGVAAGLSTSAYLHDWSKHRVSLDGELNLRLVKGLSITFNGRVSLIRDQLNLPLEGATASQILLQQRQLATDYSYWGSAGITYTFGSIYNNVVNPRFGNW